MKKILFFLFLLPFVVISANSTVETPDTLVGLIVNQKGKAVRNVSVVSEISDPVMTNRRGIFVIIADSIPDKITVVFSTKQMYEVQVEKKNFIKIVIDDKRILSVNQSKDEIINIGYGFERKASRSSSASTVSGEDLLATGESDLIRALVGKLPGVQMAYNSDGTPTLRIRGSTSFDDDKSNPLFIVDGVINDNPSALNIADIKQVDVLKDGSMYGAKGANGVVIITMKH